jgi:hypothetical protein
MSMKIKPVDNDVAFGRVILNKGKREPGGHHFEIFVRNAIFYATIIHASNPMLKETFEINPRKFAVLEKAVDARIEELMW